MKILYKNKNAEEQFSSKYKKQWRYPKTVIIKLLSMENLLKSATCLQDIFNYSPAHLHPLQGNMRGKWSVYLGKTGYRVILIPCDDDGEEILAGDILAQCKFIKVVEITEVTNHYE